MSRGLPGLLAFGLAATLLLAGCGGEYAAERRLWRAEKLMKKLAADPAPAPAGLFVQTRESFEAVLREFPRSTAAASALFSIGRLHLMAREPRKAEETFQKIVAEHSTDRAIAASALSAMAALQERDGRRAEADRSYQDLMARYEGTSSSLPAPLYLARRASREGNPQAAETAYTDAAHYYQNLERKNHGQPLGLA